MSEEPPKTPRRNITCLILYTVQFLPYGIFAVLHKEPAIACKSAAEKNTPALILQIIRQKQLMKNTLLIIICILSVSATQAQSQLAKGEKLAGLQFTLIEGDHYYSYPALSFGSNHSTYGLNITPTYGMALKRNWVVGGQVTLGFVHDKYNDGYGTSLTKYYDAGIAPFTRLYLDILRNGKLKLFGVGSIELTYHSRDYSYSTSSGSGGTESNSSETSLHAALGFGVAYFGNGLSVDMSVSGLGLRMGFYLPYRGTAKK
jgi:hypothetical protein